MATTAWSELLKEILIELPGVSDPLAEQHIKNAAIDFCMRSWVWIVDQGPIPVAAGINDYQWDLTSTQQVARVLAAWLDKEPILPKTRNELSGMYGDFMQVEGSPRWFVQDVSDTLILVPTPTADAVDGLTAKTAIAPTRDATGIDSDVFARHYDTLAIGAKARLMGIQSKPWTNLQYAAVLEQKFDMAVAKAKLEVQRSFAGARLRVPAQFL